MDESEGGWGSLCCEYLNWQREWRRMECRERKGRGEEEEEEAQGREREKETKT